MAEAPDVLAALAAQGCPLAVVVRAQAWLSSWPGPPPDRWEHRRGVVSFAWRVARRELSVHSGSARHVGWVAYELPRCDARSGLDGDDPATLARLAAWLEEKE